MPLLGRHVVESMEIGLSRVVPATPVALAVEEEADVQGRLGSALGASCNLTLLLTALGVQGNP